MRARPPSALTEAGSDAPARIVRVHPGDGASGVLCDAPVLARLSHPCEPSSLGPDSFGVHDEAGPVPGRLCLSPDGCLVIWQPLRPLRAGSEHAVLASGLRCRRGHPVAPHLSRFRAGPFSGDELAP